jgi:hypothetical protein
MRVLEEFENCLALPKFGPGEDRFGPPPYRIGTLPAEFGADSGQTCTPSQPARHPRLR